MEHDEGRQNIVVARAAERGGLTLVALVRVEGGKATVRRILGASYRYSPDSKRKLGKAIEIDASAVIRPATRRELGLGYPV